jgi:DNA-binding NarL/FixJ family response regulator
VAAAERNGGALARGVTMLRKSAAGARSRERDVLVMVSRACSNKRIARTLGISPDTLKSHVKCISSKLPKHPHRGAIWGCVA